MSRKRTNCPGPVDGVNCKNRRPIGPRGGRCPACHQERVRIINWCRRNNKRALPPGFRSRLKKDKPKPATKPRPESRFSEEVLRARSVQAEQTIGLKGALRVIDTALRKA